MSNRWSLLVVVGVLFVSGLVMSLSPRAAVEPFKLPGLAKMEGFVLHSEVAETPPSEVLMAAQEAVTGMQSKTAGPLAPTRVYGAQFREAYFASVRCLPGSTAQESPTLEVWSFNAAPSSHILFNRFQVKLSDGSLAADSTGHEVGPGQWLHVMYQMPSTAASSERVEYEAELIESGVLIDYIHDVAQGQTCVAESD
jgi:hypothetical protein